MNLEATVLSETESREETGATCHKALPSGYSHCKGEGSKGDPKEGGAWVSRVHAGSPGFGSQNQDISNAVDEKGRGHTSV